MTLIHDDVYIDPTPADAALLSGAEMQLEAGGMPNQVVIRIATASVTALCT